MKAALNNVNTIMETLEECTTFTYEVNRYNGGEHTDPFYVLKAFNQSADTLLTLQLSKNLSDITASVKQNGKDITIPIIISTVKDVLNLIYAIDAFGKSLKAMEDEITKHKPMGEQNESVIR